MSASTVSAAKFIGRVGGLAVALGVGTAVFVGAGSAWADGGSSDPESSAPAAQDSSAQSSPKSASPRTGSAKSASGAQSKARSRLAHASTSDQTAPAAGAESPSSAESAAIRHQPTAVVSPAPASSTNASPTTASPTTAANTAGPFGDSIVTNPEITWVEGVLRGAVNATSTSGLPLTFSILSKPSLGGKIDFIDPLPTGDFSYLPYMTTLTNSSQQEQFSILVGETTPFNEFLERIPLLGLLAPSLINLLYQVPIVNRLLSPIIGDSEIVEFDVNPYTLSAERPVSFTYRMPSFDGTPISINYFPAVNVSTGEVDSAPTVLLGAGLATAGNTDPYSIWGPDTVRELPFYIVGVEPLRTDQAPTGYDGGGGYNVLSWDSRGKFDSGGVLQMNSPFWEGRDVSSIISFLTSSSNPAQGQIAMEAPGDPRIGMVGASYGGGIQPVVAGTPDRRVDAIVPMLAWNSLSTSLYPNENFKTAWGSVLLLDLVSIGARINTQIYQGILQGVFLGRLSESSQALLADSGPTILVNNIDVPTLLLQGTVDGLFTLEQAVANAEQISAANPATPLKMSWFCGGHGACLDPDDPLQEYRNMTDTLMWMDQYVAESSTSADFISTFQWMDQQGESYSSDLLPFEAGFNNPTPLTYDGVGGGLFLLPFIGGSRHVKISAPFPESIIEFTLASDAKNAINTTIELPANTQIAGAPSVSFTYNGIGTARAVYAQLVDNATGRVVGNMVTAVPVTLDGRQHTVELPMEYIAYTRYTDSDSLTLQITSSASAYEDFTAFGHINISNINLELPTVDLG